MRILVCVAGAKAGEAMLAVGLIGPMRARGHSVDVVVDSARNAELVGGAVLQVNWATAWWSGYAPGEWEAVVAVSSYTCATHLRGLSLTLEAPVMTLESSWIPWYDHGLHGLVDEFVLQFPERVRQAGLLANGGSFSLPAELQGRHRAHGWVFPMTIQPLEERSAARARFDIEPQSSLVVMYPSSANGFDRVRATLIDAALTLDEQLPGSLVIALGHSAGSDWPVPMRTIPWVSPGEFAALCAAADLVVPAGMGLTAISALRGGVPVVVWTVDDPDGPMGWGYREAACAANAGLIQHVPGTAPASALAAALHAGLTNGPLRSSQVEAATDPGDGAAAIISRLQELVVSRELRGRTGTWRAAACAARVAGQLEDARRMVDARLRCEPADQHALVESAELAFLSGDWRVAARDFERALELADPGVAPSISAVSVQLRAADALRRLGLELRSRELWEDSLSAFAAGARHAAVAAKWMGPLAPGCAEVQAALHEELRAEHLATAAVALADARIAEGAASSLVAFVGSLPPSIAAHPRVTRILPRAGG